MTGPPDGSAVRSGAADALCYNPQLNVRMELDQPVPPDHSASRPEEGATRPPQEPEGRGGLGWKVWVRDIVFALLTAVLLIVFVVQPVRVEGTSMEPRLHDQERIFVNKFVYQLGEIQRGDIVVFWYPRDPDKSFIKRVIGLPGEEIAIRNGIVYVDGVPLEEPYVPPQYFDHGSFGPVVVPENCYFVLGDHRNSSNDSRAWGCVPRENIFGKAVFRYWPLTKLGLIE